MKILVAAALRYGFPRDSQVILSLEASFSDDQFIHEERLDIRPATALLRDTRSDGSRLIRTIMSGTTDIAIMLWSRMSPGLRCRLRAAG